MIKNINKGADVNFSGKTYVQLEDRLMIELETRDEFTCYGRDCGGYCSTVYTPK